MPSPDAMFANSSSFSGRVHSDLFSNYHDPQKVVAPRAHKPPPATATSSSSCRGAEQQCSTQHSSRLTASLQQAHELCSGQLELQRILLQGGNPIVPELPSASIFGVSPPVRSGACGGAANPIAHDHSWTRSAYCASRTNLQALREIDSSGHPFLRSMENSDLVLGSPVLGPMLPATIPATRPAAGPAAMQQQQELPFGGFTGLANFSFSAVPAAAQQQHQQLVGCRPQPPRPRPPSPPRSPPSPPLPRPPPSPGVYRRRTDSDFLISKTWGIDIWAFDVVSSQAVINCRRIMEGMMSAAPGLTVPNGLRKYGLTVAIIGSGQRLTDLKPYAFLRGVATSDGRLWDDVRGVGATGIDFPYSSVAEENLLFLLSDPYAPYQSIMVREFAVSVLNVGLFDAGTNTAVVSAFNAAVTRNAGSFGSVRPAGFQDKDQYWAVMSEAWFESITRTDVNLGITTRSSLLISDPAIASIFQSTAYGSGSWLYSLDPNLPKAALPTSAVSYAPLGELRLRVAQLQG